MSFTAWRTARLRRLAHRIIADRKDGVLLRSTFIPGGAIIGMGFANTFLRHDHNRRVERVITRIIDKRR